MVLAGTDAATAVASFGSGSSLVCARYGSQPPSICLVRSVVRQTLRQLVPGLSLAEICPSTPADAKGWEAGGLTICWLHRSGQDGCPDRGSAAG